jgi:hypothetical protein
MRRVEAWLLVETKSIGLASFAHVLNYDTTAGVIALKHTPCSSQHDPHK